MTKTKTEKQTRNSVNKEKPKTSRTSKTNKQTNKIKQILTNYQIKTKNQIVLTVDFRCPVFLRTLTGVNFTGLIRLTIHQLSKFQSINFLVTQMYEKQTNKQVNKQR